MTSIEKSTDEELGEAIDRLTERLQSGDDVDLTAFFHEFPQQEEHLRKLVPVIQEMARLHRRAGTDVLGGTVGVASEESLPALSDYQILEEIGRGGMGVVFRARQQTLDRIVALKVLPLASLADSRQVARFHNEARAAATLQHPHIVPVYSVGVERGIHYYAMQYIEGPTLAQTIEKLRALEPPVTRRPHGDDKARSRRDTRQDAEIAAARIGQRGSSPSSYCRTVACWGLQVAEALMHAHEHGIVHRDIKPGNLLVDEADDIWITDFGLARLELGTTITGSGAVLGTWRYMSPEQAAGNSTLVDHRTDIYSLGATLYEAITLQPAFAGSSRHELLQQIESRTPSTPRSICPAIPVDLETIVLKAMNKEPAERYSTAAGLADDLQRFLEGRPIQARRASVAQRLRRTIKRHSDLVFVAALALLVASLSISIAAVMTWQANQKTQAALARQDAALQRATDKTRMARRAADEMYRNISLQGIASDPELTATQRRFLNSALSIYEQLSQESSREFSAQLETGHTLAHMGDVLSMSGRWKEALEAAAQAINVLEPLSRSQPDNVEVLRPLGQLYHNYAIRLGRAGRTEQAIAANHEAAAVVERLSKLEPEDLQHQVMLASIELNQSVALRSLGRLRDAEAAARRAWECAAAVARKFDTVDLDAWSTAFRAAGGLASVLQDLRRVEEAEQVCRQAVVECEKLIADQPGDVRLARLLGKLQGVLGGKLADQDKLPEAEAILRAALASMERSLPQDDSPAELFQTELNSEASLDQSCDPAAFLSHALDQVRLGEVLHRQEKYDEAVGVLQEATFVLEQLLVRYPDERNFQGALAQGEWFLARVLRKKEEPHNAERHFRKAVELYLGLTEQNPRIRVSLSMACNQLGNLLIDEDRHAEAREAFEAGIEQAEKALEWMPDQPDARDSLKFLRANLARANDGEPPPTAVSVDGKP